MCVIVAMKLPRDRKTGKPIKDSRWRLAKIRDRVYDAHYKIRRYSIKEHGASMVFVTDADTDWTEGVSVLENDSYLSLVNSALNNHSDKKDGKTDKTTSVSNNGLIIRGALKSKNIDTAVRHLVNNKFDGCTLLTDGERLIIIETSIPPEVAEKYRNQLNDGQRFEDIVPLEEYETNSLEIKEDYLIVRTNTGVLDDSFGYQEKDGRGYTSAIKRRDYTLEYLESVYEPIELITTLAKLGNETIDKDPFFRPIRLKGQAKLQDNDVDIYTTSIIQTDPSGTMIIKPIECTFDTKNVQNLIGGKFKTHVVILPHRSRMFEGFKDLLLSLELKGLLL